ncbi:MAG: hypothetical protein Q4C16_09395, partial [Eubacteriales bacterium]|nr:hypothetical protein [Eubacteriales bacterium]
SLEWAARSGFVGFPALRSRKTPARLYTLKASAMSFAANAGFPALAADFFVENHKRSGLEIFYKIW